MPDPAPPSPEPKSAERRSGKPDLTAKEAQRLGWLYATALGFVGTVAILAAVGFLLDRWLKTLPLFLLVFLVIGLVGGMWKFVREAKQANKR